MDPLFLESEDVLAIHRDQIERYGGSPGVRDARLLESAVHAARAGTADGFVHADLFDMAAAYLFHIVHNHPFVDGNKRAGAAAALVFLDINGAWPDLEDEVLVDLALGVAEGRTTKPDVAAALRRAGTPPGLTG